MVMSVTTQTVFPYMSDAHRPAGCSGRMRAPIFLVAYRPMLTQILATSHLPSPPSAALSLPGQSEAERSSEDSRRSIGRSEEAGCSKRRGETLGWRCGGRGDGQGASIPHQCGRCMCACVLSSALIACTWRESLSARTEAQGERKEREEDGGIDAKN